MNYKKFQVSEFKLSSMADHPSIVMIAKRGSGKSFVTRDIIYHYRHIPGGAVIAPTDRLNHFYKYFFPDLYIHYDIKESILAKILARQIKMIKKADDKKKEGKKVNPAAILVMDDCLSQKKTWVKNQKILEILMNGRHYRLTYILTMQTPLGIPPDLRLNFDYVFLLKEDSTINKKKLWDNYASVFPSLTAFEMVFDKCTEDYRCMVIDNRKPNSNISQKIFWFKAVDRKFSFGSKKFKTLHKQYYDPTFMSKVDPIGIESLITKKPKDLDLGVVLK